jgi:RecA-family ATPase
MMMKPQDVNDIHRNRGIRAVRQMHDQGIVFNGSGYDHDGENRKQIEVAAEEINLKLICAGELLKKKAPMRAWFCEPWIPQDEVTLLGGDGGLGKSTLTCQAAISSALGIQWLGYDIARGRTLILTCEDGRNELHFRLEQILSQESPYALQDALEALMSIFIIDATRDLDPTLATYDERTGIQPTALYHAIKAAIKENRIDFFIVDSLADVFGREIERHAARSFIRLLRDIGCTVLLIAHPSKAGMRDGTGYSGSTHWNNSVRSRLNFERAKTEDDGEPDLDLRVLELAKNNRAKAGTKIFLRWKEGRFVPENTSAQSLENLQKALKVEELFLKLLTQFNEQGRKVSPNRGQTYSAKLFSEHSDSNGFSPKAFAKAQQTLLDARKIKIVEGGPPSRRYHRLEVCP